MAPEKTETVEVSARELRKRLAEVLDATRYERRTYVITRNGRPMAQIVPIENEAAPATRRKRS